MSRFLKRGNPRNLVCPPERIGPIRIANRAAESKLRRLAGPFGNFSPLSCSGQAKASPLPKSPRSRGSRACSLDFLGSAHRGELSPTLSMREFLDTPVLAHVGAGSFDSALAFVSESQGSAQDDRTLDVWEFPQFPSPHGPPALRSGILRRFILTSEPR